MAWNPFGVMFELKASGSNVVRTSATQFTVKITARWETYYSGAQTNYGMTASSGGSSVTLNKFGTYSSSGSGSFTGTYSISGNGSATKSITVTFKNFNNDNGDSATTTVSFNVTVPAWTSYTVSYNANGGSGAPSSQTKWKGQSLTLSSTKPTRTGYTFEGWALSKSDADNGTWYYQAGGSCGKNENLTLYATWEENKLTVNYYSNYADYGTYKGESLSVSASTNVKVHTQDFLYDNSYSSALSNVQNTSYLYMSRTGYTPTGYWGTSTSGGTLIDEDADYSTGQALAKALGKDISSGNASVNVYPQWQINTYTIGYDGNGGYGSMNVQSVNWQETFVLLDNKFKREGYKFIGWNAQREVDRKWYVNGQGWITEDEILAGGYEKKIYLNQSELIFDMSWIKGETGVIHQYTMYAIWEISGVVYISNDIAIDDNGGTMTTVNGTWLFNDILNLDIDDFVENVNFRATTIYIPDGVKYSGQCTAFHKVDDMLGYYVNDCTPEEPNDVVPDVIGIYYNGWNEYFDDNVKIITFTEEQEVSDKFYAWLIANATPVIFEPYLIYIDNGTSWDLYIAYIDNGTNWEIVS